MYKWLSLFLILSVGIAHSTLEVNVVKKDKNAFPIAISKFELIGKDAKNKDIAQIIHNNLTRSGRFNVFIPSAIVKEFDSKYWKAQNIEAVVTGTIKQESEKIYRVTVTLYDVYSNIKLIAQSTRVDVNGFRKVAHQISDEIYEALLGENGSFNTLLTYITVKKNKKGERIYQLNISDADAMNAKSRIKLTKPMLSPTWSPESEYKNKKIAYVSFKNGRSEVFIWHPYVNKKIQKLPHFDGIVSSPSWHPNGKSLLMTMSRNGNKDIYEYNLVSQRFIRWTKHKGIDTEASYSPNGKSIVFTSDRYRKQPQIYIKDLKSGRVKRATFSGRYNTKATYSPDGKHLALVHRVDDDYRIAMLNIKTNEISIISNGHLDESPHFSPNGDMIIFSSNHKGKGVLFVVSVEGNRSYELSSYNAEVRGPNWSTHLQINNRKKE